MMVSDLKGITEAVLAFAGASIHGASFGLPGTIKPLVDLGVLAPTGQLSEVACEECDEHHMASVIVTAAGPRAVCFRTGLEYLPEGALTIFEVRVVPLVDALADDLDRLSRWAQPRAEPFLWSLGSFAHLDLRVGVYFMLNAGDLERWNDAMGWLKRDPRTDAIAVLTNETRDLSDIVLPWDGRVVKFADYACPNDRGRWTLDRTRLAKRVLPTHLLHPRDRGRPNSAYTLAAELIPEVDREGALRAIRSRRHRHRVVLAAARERHGANTTLSREPCEQAFQDYLRKNQY